MPRINLPPSSEAALFTKFVLFAFFFRAKFLKKFRQVSSDSGKAAAAADACEDCRISRLNLCKDDAFLEIKLRAC